MNRYYLSDTNPNDACGGRGCACSNSHVEGCEGPFTIFYGTETDSLNSPHVVLGAACARDIVAKLDGEIGSAGEPDPVIDVTFVEVPADDFVEPLGEDGEGDPFDL